MSRKIIVSGNPGYGLGEALKRRYPEASFYSRSTNDTNLSNFEERERFAKLTLDYDTYISCSCLSQFRQTLLLEMVYRQWLESKKKGHIICLGSTADATVKGGPWVYPIEKKALRAYCRNLSMASLGGHGNNPSGIRISYISPGYLDTPRANDKHPGVKKIDVDYLSSVIDWVMNQPAHINLSELCLDPVQPEL